MTALLTGPFAEALAAGRPRYNALFTQARRAHPRLDAEAWADVLRFTLAPLAAAVETAAPDRTPEVVDALYPLALDLLGQDLLGPAARRPAVALGWGTALPRLGRFVAEAPRRVAASVTNALFHLSNTPGARPDEWVNALLRLAEVCPDADTLLGAGQVAAWRAGLAQYRTGALDLARALPPAAARAALGLPAAAASVQLLVDRLAADPWLTPEQAENPAQKRELALVARVGAFRGWGGLFLRPPILEPAGEQFLVTDGEGTWHLVADIFGAAFFHAPGGGLSTASAPAFTLDKGGTVHAGGQAARFPELAAATSWAASPTTLAVTTALSHTIRLIAWI